MYEFEEKFFNIFRSIIENIGEKEIKYLELVESVSKEHKKDLVEECIDFLIYNNSIRIISKGKKIQNASIKLEKKPDILRKLDIKENNPIELVLSSPPYDKAGLESHLEKNDIHYTDMYTTFLNMIRKAESSIQICSPFIEYNGFSLLESEITNKLRQGVNIDILTRLDDARSNTSRIKEITKIKKSIKVNKRNFRLYDYYHQQNGYLASSTHAKIIIIDKKIAYSGSGEIRKNSFMKNFELGITVKGTLARDISKIFDYMLLVSEEIIEI